MLQIVSWNVNSIKSRILHLQEFIKKESPDVILLQELKCTDDKFPYMEIEDLGYNIATHGQKTYNGVAILSKYPINDITIGLPSFEDEQARYIEACINVNDQLVRLASIYVPNGQSPGSEKFMYKMSFLEALKEHFIKILQYEEIFIAGGDYNIAPNDIDVYDHINLDGSICFHIDERKWLHSITNELMLDSYRLKYPDISEFSWWDYRGGSWQKNKGMRIDHILASPIACNYIDDSGIYKWTRDLEKPSDHAPVFTLLNI